MGPGSLLHIKTNAGAGFADLGMNAVKKNEFAILDPGLRRAIAIAARGNAKLVCWNPGAVDLPDRNLGADEWRKFICVEPATLFNEDATVKIAPGESHELLMAVQAVPEK